MAELKVGDVIATYLTLRNQKEALVQAVKAKTVEIDAKMTKIEAWIKQQADTQGVTSFKSEHGTAFLTTVDYANVADWDATLRFIRESEAYDMLEKRVSKTAVRAYIDQTKSVPPGVNYGTKLEVNIRKPGAKIEE
jgi:hypothetical protein